MAIDNVRLYRGGVEPWKEKDSENGFVLVNPLPQPHTFSASDLAGNLSRTGIHRIKGTQAPDVNNGQAVTGSLNSGAIRRDHLAGGPPSRDRPPRIVNQGPVTGTPVKRH